MLNASKNERITVTERVTIKSIARDLGISHMTVSRALSNRPNVHAETREAVLKRAQELGYVKNAAAKAMRGDGTRIVGLLLPNIVNEFYARFANTLAHACEEKSYHLVIHLTDDDIAAEQRAIERLYVVQAMAVVMVPAPGEAPREETHLKTMKVIQLIRQRPMNVPTAAILVQDSGAIRDAVVHLASRGHREIGYIGADAGLSSGRSRLAAFRDGLKQAGLNEKPGLIFTDTPSFGMGQESARKVLDQVQATAIVCGGVEISNGALSTLIEGSTQNRLKVAFMGYGDPSFYSWISGGVSTIAIPIDSLAHQAVALLGKKTPPAEATNPILFPANLILRSNAS